MLLRYTASAESIFTREKKRKYSTANHSKRVSFFSSLSLYSLSLSHWLDHILNFCPHSLASLSMCFLQLVCVTHCGKLYPKLKNIIKQAKMWSKEIFVKNKFINRPFYPIWLQENCKFKKIKSLASSWNELYLMDFFSFTPSLTKFGNESDPYGGLVCHWILAINKTFSSLDNSLLSPWWMSS